MCQERVTKQNNGDEAGENHPLQERLLLSLHSAWSLGLQCLDRHAKEDKVCCCQFCRDARGLTYQLRMFASVLECQMYPLAERRQQVLKILEREIETGESTADADEWDKPLVITLV